MKKYSYVLLLLCFMQEQSYAMKPNPEKKTSITNPSPDSLIQLDKESIANLILFIRSEVAQRNGSIKYPATSIQIEHVWKDVKTKEPTYFVRAEATYSQDLSPELIRRVRKELTFAIPAKTLSRFGVAIPSEQ